MLIKLISLKFALIVRAQRVFRGLIARVYPGVSGFWIQDSGFSNPDIGRGISPSKTRHCVLIECLCCCLFVCLFSLAKGNVSISPRWRGLAQELLLDWVSLTYGYYCMRIPPPITLYTCPSSCSIMAKPNPQHKQLCLWVFPSYFRFQIPCSSCSILLILGKQKSNPVPS